MSGDEWWEGFALGWSPGEDGAAAHMARMAEIWEAGRPDRERRAAEQRERMREQERVELAREIRDKWIDIQRLLGEWRRVAPHDPNPVALAEKKS